MRSMRLKSCLRQARCQDGRMSAEQRVIAHENALNQCPLLGGESGAYPNTVPGT